MPSHKNSGCFTPANTGLRDVGAEISWVWRRRPPALVSDMVLKGRAEAPSHDVRKSHAQTGKLRIQFFAEGEWKVECHEGGSLGRGPSEFTWQSGERLVVPGHGVVGMRQHEKSILGNFGVYGGDNWCGFFPVHPA